MPDPTPRPRVLTIAGSDSSGGAGIQADLKTFAAHGVYGASALTAVTAQSTLGVTAVEELSPDLVGAQIDAVLGDVGADAVKIGMLANAGIIAAVTRALERHRPRWVVLDPVMVAESGDALLRDDAVETLVRDLLPLADLVTPNLPEAVRLTGLPVGALDERATAARRLVELGAGAALVKGGHGDGGEVVDLLAAGGEIHRFSHPRLATRATHGTGCTLSSAIAARLASGEELTAAVAGAIDYLHGAIAAAFPLGGGRGPVDHLYLMRGAPSDVRT